MADYSQQTISRGGNEGSLYRRGSGLRTRSTVNHTDASPRMRSQSRKRASTSIAPKTTAVKSTAESRRGSPEEETIFCLVLCLFVVVILLIISLFFPRSATSSSKVETRFSDPLADLAVTFKECAQVVPEPEIVNRMSNLATGVAQFEQDIHSVINGQVAPAVAAVRSNPENCDAVNQLWNALNTTRTTTSRIDTYSRYLMGAAIKAGPVIDDKLHVAQADYDRSSEWGSVFWNYTMTGRILTGKSWFKVSVEERDILSRYKTLEQCQKTQRSLLALARDRQSRLGEFLNKVNQWSDHPRHWIGANDQDITSKINNGVDGLQDLAAAQDATCKVSACKVKDDIGGVDGLWAIIKTDASATWGDLKIEG